MDILILTSRRQAFSPLTRSQTERGHAFYFAEPDENFYHLIRGRGLRTVILDAAEDASRTIQRIRDIRAFDPGIELVLIGPDIPDDVRLEPIRNGTGECLSWPPDPEEAWAALERIATKARLRQETKRLERELSGKYLFQGMVGRSPEMLEVFAVIEKVARYPSPILITGPTGTGKELAARAIHDLSPRRHQPLVVCNCAAIPETLFESELFGYVRGAFTGADRTKDGYFREAHDGTLFLDEIGEVPLPVQTKLLRALEDHQIRPLGANRFVKADVRVIAATNRDLRAAVREGWFREDLLQRLGVVQVELPALRDRRDDIPLLCRYFLDRINRKFSKNVAGISLRAQKVLGRYSWPGNVRELENVLERAVMLSVDDFLDLKDLPDYLKASVSTDKGAGPYPYGHLTLAEMERKHILAVLGEVSRNKVQAARRLGLNRQTLYRKLRKYGLHD